MLENLHSSLFREPIRAKMVVSVFHSMAVLDFRTSINHSTLTSNNEHAGGFGLHSRRELADTVLDGHFTTSHHA